MKKLQFFLFICISIYSYAQPLPRPKLVVGVVIDQMRWDYLYRFYDRFGEGGFRRLINDGLSCENTFIPYLPAHTAAGHSSIYSGSVPALDGIIGNNWYDREQKKLVYCTDDSSVHSVGSTSEAGRMSPKNLWSTTIGDELRMATNFRSKTISIAIKDRASILPGGHSSNGSFWFDNATGGWITSTYYMQELPSWIRTINDKKLPDQYLKQNWNTLYPLSTYVQSTSDTNSFEGKLLGEDASFPHMTADITSNRYETFRTTPGAVSFTFETAKAAIKGENLGGRGITDFLAVSVSSTDYAGHTFGPNSVEIEDMYLRLDRELASFLRYLDASVGKGQYILFLTADHGAAHNWNFLKSNKLPFGSFDQTKVRRELNAGLEAEFHTKNIIEQYINYQVFINDSIVRSNGLDGQKVRQFIMEFLLKQPAVSNVVDLHQVETATLPEAVKTKLVNGFNQKLSGDIQTILKPSRIEGWQTGTSHGYWNPYDTHIPLLWFGWKVKPGRLTQEVYMTDIAPTLAAMLHIQMPNACVGKVIEGVAR